MWTCLNNESFLSFTAHWIYPEFISQYGVLAVKPSASSHTGINSAKELIAIAERWNIAQDKINLLVHDSGANMVKVVRVADFESARCFIHSMQRAIKELFKSQTDVLEMVAALR